LAYSELLPSLIYSRPLLTYLRATPTQNAYSNDASTGCTITYVNVNGNEATRMISSLYSEYMVLACNRRMCEGGDECKANFEIHSPRYGSHQVKLVCICIVHTIRFHDAHNAQYKEDRRNFKETKMVLLESGKCEPFMQARKRQGNRSAILHP